MTHTLDEVVTKLREIPCPRCLTLGAAAVTRRDLLLGECAYLGNCSSCGWTFDPDVAAELLERLKQETHMYDRAEPCAMCGAHETEIHFACEAKPHGCFFVATCGACTHTFRIRVGQ